MTPRDDLTRADHLAIEHTKHVLASRYLPTIHEKPLFNEQNTGIEDALVEINLDT